MLRPLPGNSPYQFRSVYSTLFSLTILFKDSNLCFGRQIRPFEYLCFGGSRQSCPGATYAVDWNLNVKNQPINQSVSRISITHSKEAPRPMNIKLFVLEQSGRNLQAREVSTSQRTKQTTLSTGHANGHRKPLAFDWQLQEEGARRGMVGSSLSEGRFCGPSILSSLCLLLPILSHRLEPNTSVSVCLSVCLSVSLSLPPSLPTPPPPPS